MSNYIKSPLNYIGGKYKLLDKIIPLFPKDIKTFVDLFGGGFNVGINVKADKIIYNDYLSPVCNLIAYIQSEETEQLLKEIDGYIEEYQLSKKNIKGYLKLRKDYNDNPIYNYPTKFYTLICYAFNNQIRFNRKGEYNMPFGKDRSSFNPVLRQKFILFSQRLKEISCEFETKHFDDFNYKDLTKDDLVYCDPPYLGSVATYNENGGWSKFEEMKLLTILDTLDKKGIRFALSNNLKYENPFLKEWSKKYKVNYLNADYNNCNYQKKDRSKDCEVLIINY